MTDNELKFIRLTFQLHKLIAEGKEDATEADGIRDEMEVIDNRMRMEGNERVTENMSDISAWCYALTETDPELKVKYRRLLFEGIWS